MELYRSLLTLRSEADLGQGSLEWQDGYGDEVLVFTNGDITVVSNTGVQPVALPAGEVLVTSQNLESGALPGYATAWVRSS